MAELGPLMQPTPVSPQPMAYPGTPEFEQNRQSWLQVLQEPHVRAGMLQFAVQAMQPVAVGQSPLGALGQAIGSGVEASDRVTEQQMEQQKQLADQQLAQERINAENARVGQAASEARNRTALGYAEIDARRSLLEREYALRQELERLPPNLMSEAMKGYMQRASAIENNILIRDPAEKEAARLQALEDSINAAKTIGGSFGSGGVPGAGAATPQATPQSFGSEADAAAAAKAGKIKSGDKIIVNGKSGTWQ